MGDASEIRVWQSAQASCSKCTFYGIGFRGGRGQSAHAMMCVSCLADADIADISERRKREVDAAVARIALAESKLAAARAAEHQREQQKADARSAAEKMLRARVVAIAVGRK